MGSRSRSVRARGRRAVAALALGLACVLSAGEGWPSPPPIPLEALFERLEPVQPATWEWLRAEDPAVLDSRVPREDVLAVGAADARPLLEAMVANGWGTMHFFAHPIFARERRILFYSGAVLRELMREYSAPTIFPVRGRTTRDVKGPDGIVPAGTPFEIEGLLLGRGRIVVIYPFRISVQRSEPPFAFGGGHYSLGRVSWAKITTSAGSYRIEGLRGRDRPGGPARYVYGPANLPILGLELPRDGDRVVVFTLLGMRLSFDQPLVGRREREVRVAPP